MLTANEPYLPADQRRHFQPDPPRLPVPCNLSSGDGYSRCPRTHARRQRRWRGRRAKVRVRVRRKRSGRPCPRERERERERRERERERRERERELTSSSQPSARLLQRLMQLARLQLAATAAATKAIRHLSAINPAPSSSSSSLCPPPSPRPLPTAGKIPGRRMLPQAPQNPKP